MYLFINLSKPVLIYLSICLSLCLCMSVCFYLYIDLFISVLFFLSFFLSINITSLSLFFLSFSFFLPIYQSLYLILSLSIYLLSLSLSLYIYMCVCVCVCVCLSLCLSMKSVIHWFINIASLFIYLFLSKSVFLFSINKGNTMNTTSIWPWTVYVTMTSSLITQQEQTYRPYSKEAPKLLAWFLVQIFTCQELRK